MSYTKQIQELNTYVKTRIAPSKIHGVGVFALRDIHKGQRLYTDLMPKVYTLPYAEFRNLFPQVREILTERFPSIVEGSNFISPDTRIQAYMNHSDTPNYDALEDIALEDIEEGEEITEDYRKIKGHEKIWKWLEKKI